MNKKVVIKIGSSNLVKNGAANGEKIEKLAEIVKEYTPKGYDFIIVSSGAVALGRERAGMTGGVLTINQKQAMAAIGQPLLMKCYDDKFSQKGIVTAQVLLTKDDLHNRKRYINSRETIWELLNFKVVPIINENDTVSTTEIKIGDNDNLSALVAAATEADILIIMSDIDGLYNKNPKEYDDAVLISDVTEITEEIEKNAGGAGSSVGTGGMATKLQAAKLCMKFGIEMYIVNGKNIDNIREVLDETGIGTKFHPEHHSAGKRKMWIAYGLKPKGKIYIDNGAKDALLNGNSLLAKGVYKSEGEFKENDMVIVCSEQGMEISRGLVNYSSDNMNKILKKYSHEIEEILGAGAKKEVIHRDNMYIEG